MNNHKGYVILQITKQEYNFWNFYFNNLIICDTENLFISAHRPYWDYYISDIDEWFLKNIDNIEKTKDLKWKNILENKKNDGFLYFNEDLWREKILNIIKDYKDEEFFILTTKNRKNNVIKKIKKEYPKIKNYEILALPDNIVTLEIEPSWHLITDFLKDKCPKIIILSLGWEKLIYAARFKKFQNSTVIDIGDTEIFLEKNFLFKKKIKFFIKNAINYFNQKS